MALALSPAPHALAEVMPLSSSMKPDLDCRIIVSSSSPKHHDAFTPNDRSSPLSPEESDDDTPMSPITFQRNEEYERSRLSYMPPPPRPSSSSPSSPVSPYSPGSLSPLSPVIFSQQNASSPSIALQPPPVFPSAGTQSLAMRLKRPLPPLPKVDTYSDSGAVEPRSRHERIPAHTRPSPSSSDSRDNDSVKFFSPAASATPSPATSTYTSPTSESSGSWKPVWASPTAEPRPRFPPLTIPVRSQSTPIPQAALIGRPIVAQTGTGSPHISVTPASPGAHQDFPTFSDLCPRQKSIKRTASATSVVLPSPYDDGREPSSEPEYGWGLRTGYAGMDMPRAASPAPSLTPSVSSAKSFTILHTSKMGLKRIASKTRLFGRRTLSSASKPSQWDSDSEEDTIIGHTSTHSHSMDDRMLRPGQRARSESPSTLVSDTSSAGKASVDDTSMRTMSVDDPHTLRRLEIVEATWTPEGDVWELRELCDVIPKLRQLRASSKIKP